MIDFVQILVPEVTTERVEHHHDSNALAQRK
jgi:hypothetical protein